MFWMKIFRKDTGTYILLTPQIILMSSQIWECYLRWLLMLSLVDRGQGETKAEMVLYFYTQDLHSMTSKASCTLSFPFSPCQGRVVRKMSRNLQFFWEKVKHNWNISSQSLPFQTYLEIIHLTKRSVGKSIAWTLWIPRERQTMTILILSQLHFWKSFVSTPLLLTTYLPLHLLEPNVFSHQRLETVQIR